MAYVCSKPECPNLRPCPLHPDPQPWAGSTRKTRRRAAGWTEQRDARRILQRDHGICHICHQAGADTVDHVTPLAEGGPDTDDNKAAIHAKPCHQHKTATEAARARTAHHPA